MPSNNLPHDATNNTMHTTNAQCDDATKHMGGSSDFDVALRTSGFQLGVLEKLVVYAQRLEFIQCPAGEGPCERGHAHVADLVPAEAEESQLIQCPTG